MDTRQVLIVDDEADIREVAAMSLELVGGWQTLSAGSGQDALRIAASAQPSVILLDVMMPGLDGPKTLQLLRADPATATIPVIFLTAKAQLSEQRQLRDLDVCGVIAKPFDPMRLARDVTAILDEAAKRPGRAAPDPATPRRRPA